MKTMCLFTYKYDVLFRKDYEDMLHVYISLAALNSTASIFIGLLMFSAFGLFICSLYLFYADQRTLQTRRRERKSITKWYQRSQIIIAIGILFVALLLFSRTAIMLELLPNSTTNIIIFFILTMVDLLWVCYGVFLTKIRKPE